MAASKRLKIEKAIRAYCTEHGIEDIDSWSEASGHYIIGLYRGEYLAASVRFIDIGLTPEDSMLVEEDLTD